MSFFNIEVEQHGPRADGQEIRRDLAAIKAEMDKLKNESEASQAKIAAAYQADYTVSVNGESVTHIAGQGRSRPSAPLEDSHKKLTEDFDRSLKLTSQKEWRWWDDGVRNLPVIDGFASPTKIQQYTLERIAHRLQLQVRHPLRSLHDLPSRPRKAGATTRRP